MRAFTVIITSLVLTGGVALAQTNPGSPTTPPQPSQSSIPTQDDTNHSTGHSSSSSTASMSDTHAAMKSCITQQQQTNSGMSKTDAKKACKAQMKDSG